jgi:acetolactate synthase-1/2/3 large subunit
MKANGAEIAIRLIEREGVRIVSGIPGGANLPLYDALYASSLRPEGLVHVLARHEQGAGFIAQGMARSTGKPGVCFATSGPGATNLITALADAKLDSVPLVAITGQVPLGLLGSDAFQEIDSYGMTQSITKHNILLRSAKELLEAIPLAFRIAASGRPGPVLIDLPKDVQLEVIEFDAWPEPSRPDPAPAPDPASLAALSRMIEGSERPLLYFGGGVAMSGASEALRGFVRHARLPSASTLMGLGCLASDEQLYLGMMGMHGSLALHRIIEEADLLIALGARFDDRVTGLPERFARRAAVAHVDVDASEFNKIRRVNLSIRADIRLALEGLLPMVRAQPRQAWLERIAVLMDEAGPVLPDPEDASSGNHPQALIRRIARIAGPEAIVTTDVGQHQMWSAQAWPVERPRSFLTSGGLGTMGFGLPAAIGAALANPGKRVTCLSGDGSILMNIQELATLSELGLPVTVVIFDNGQLGLVRQQQSLFYGGRESACRFASRPDLAAVARGFGIAASHVSLGEDPSAALKEAYSRSGPSLVVLEIDPDELVLPMVPPGKANVEALVRAPDRVGRSAENR